MLAWALVTGDAGLLDEVPAVLADLAVVVAGVVLISVVTVAFELSVVEFCPRSGEFPSS